MTFTLSRRFTNWSSILGHYSIKHYRRRRRHLGWIAWRTYYCQILLLSWRALGTPFCHALVSHVLSYGPRREKTCLRGFRQSEFQTSLLSYRDKPENYNFTCSKYTYNTFQKANNKGADQTARMRRLVCACVVRKPPKTGFLASRPI